MRWWRSDCHIPSLRAQRSNADSHRGKTLDCFAALAMTAFVGSAVAPLARAFIADTPSPSRGSFCPSFASSPCPQLKEGAGKTGRRLGTRGPLCEVAVRNLHSGIQVKPRRPAFPAQRFYGLCRALPGERCTVAPVALRMADARTRSGRHITTRLDAQTPGVRTTRFCRTLIAPVVCATPSLTVARPAKPFAPVWPSVRRCPARVRDDRDTPLFLGPGCRDTYVISEFR